jgi:hypothetical protein
MVLSINALAEPVGSIKSWIRPDNVTPLPTNWLICDGTTVSDASSPFNGKAIPDLRDRHARGHTTLTNANFAVDTLYYTGGTLPTGGSDNVSLSHSHTVNSHTHSEGSHKHNISSDNHSHTISNDGSHTHTDGFAGGLWNNGFPAGSMNSAGTHNHGGGTGSDAHDHTGETASAGGGNTGSSNPGTNSQLGSTDIRPSHNELVMIIKVK